MKRILLKVFAFGLVIPVFAMEKKIDINSFIDQIPFIKFRNNFAMYEKFIKKNLRFFDGEEYKLLDVQIKLYTAWGKYNKALELLKRGTDKGYFFSLGMRLRRHQEYKPLLKMNGFETVLKKDVELRKKAILKNKMKYIVKLPSNYNNQKKYPLLFVFHGGGGNLKMAKSRWKSADLFNKFIIVYIQSYRYQESMGIFGWPSPGDKRLYKELKYIFKEVEKKYKIHYDKIVLSGMSTGGRVAIDIALKQILPARYFIGICPKKPKDLNATIVNSAKNYIKKGYILSGEHDWALKKQKEMVKVFKESKLKHTFKILPSMGHQFPVKFNILIKSIIQYFDF